MYRSKQQLYMVIDVESVGLQGEGFAIGYVIVNGMGERLAEAVHAAPAYKAHGDAASRAWVRENVPRLDFDCADPAEVRAYFWAAWNHWHAQGALLCADCPWPVESKFLLDCVQDDHARGEQGPYPLVDIGSMRLAVGLDPIGTEHRGDDELPHHHPLMDARQSARLLLEAIGVAEV